MSTGARTRGGTAIGVVVAALAVAAVASAMQFTSWGAGVKIDEIAGNHADLNTTALDGCPIQSPDGLSLYQASNRPGGHGGLDIWVATRESTDDGFGVPVSLPEPINSAADDFCPTPVRGKGLYFVSRRADAGHCGLGDIYFARLNPAHGWSEPERLACAPNGPNTVLDEQGPSYVELDGGAFLFFSSSRVADQGGAGVTAVPGDIFVSAATGEGFGAATAVTELNVAGVNDIQPNVRKDGLEVVFSSNRAGGLGGQDIWVSTRASAADLWSPPVNLGSAVNTAAGETRPSLSWDGEQLLFGLAPGPEGSSDIYVSTRAKANGK